MSYDDDYMLGALSVEDDQWLMGAPRRPRRQPNHNIMILPIVFPTFNFVAGTGTNPLSQTILPQFAFCGQQPIASVQRNGATATAALPFLNQLFVGPTPIIQTNPGPPLDNYSRDATNNNLRMPPTGLGQSYRADVVLSSALTGTDTLTVVLQVNGMAKLKPMYVAR